MAEPWAGWLQRERSEARVREAEGGGGQGAGFLEQTPQHAGEKHLVRGVQISSFTQDQLCHRHAVSIPQVLTLLLLTVTS